MAKMRRKSGGLAALMAGQPVIVKKRKPFFWRLRRLTRQGGLHIGLIFVCILYVYGGAMLFMYLEAPEELRQHAEFSAKFEELKTNFLSNVEWIKANKTRHNNHNETMLRLIDEYTKQTMKMFSNSVAANMFDCMFYTNSTYSPLWNTDSSLLFTATTIVPVGYGYIAPLTTKGRMILCVYAGFGIPLALVMMSDVGKFLADLFAKLFNENVTAFMIVLVALLVAYSILGGVAYSKAVDLSMIDGVYFSTITIFTIGYGDISPSISVYYIIAFIVFGVSLVTIAVDVVAANIIHNIHYMGRQVGKARIIADKMLMMAQKISINRGLGLGMAQLGAFARMGMMINVNAIAAAGNPADIDIETNPRGPQYDEEKEGIEVTISEEPHVRTLSTAFEPNIDFDMIDVKQMGSSRYLYGFSCDRRKSFADSSSCFLDDDGDNSVFM